MRKLTGKTNKKTILLTMSILLFTIGTLSIQQSLAVTPADPLLEDLLIDSILNMYQTSSASPSVGGFGSYDYINWQDTLEGLETLVLLNGTSQLAENQRDAISNYLKSQRPVINDGNTSWVENWWGTVKRSVEALRMNQLVDRLSQPVVEEVEQRVIDIYRSEGLHLKIGSEGWEEGYWGIVKAREWSLFDVMDEMILPLFTMDALNTMNAPPVVTSECLSQKNVVLEWIPAQSMVVAPVASSDVTTYEIIAPTLSQVSSVGDPYRSYPDYTLTIPTDMLNEWNESDFDQNNFENSTYGQEHGLLNTYDVEVPYLITNADGSNRTIYQTEQVSEWGRSGLRYMMNVTVETDDAIIEQTVINLQNPSPLIIHIDNQDINDIYTVTAKTYQLVHTKVIDNNTESWLEIPHPIAIEMPNVRTDYSAFGVGTFSTLSDGTNYLNTSDGYSYKVWSYPTSATESWSEINENLDFRFGLLYRGYGSLDITNNQSQFYRVILFPMGSEDRSNQATTNYLFDGTIESYEVTRNYLQVEENYNKYIDLVNGSVGSLDSFYEHVDMVTSLSFDVPVENLLDADAVLFKTFFNYNQTNKLFDNSWEKTLQTWKLLDTFDLTAQVFAQSEYETVLMSYFNRTYQEAQDQEGNIVNIVISDEKDTTTNQMQDTYLFVQLLVYNEPWITQTHVVGARSLVNTLDPIYVGFAVLPTVEKKTEYELILESQDEFFVEMYERYGEDLGKVLDKNTPKIKLCASQFMPSHLMHWLDLDIRSPMLIDYLVHLGVGIFAGLCVIVGSFDNFTHRRLLIGLITGLVIMVQALSTPILQSGFSEGIYELMQASEAITKMLEDGIYKISSELGGIGNRIFAKQVDYPNNEYSTSTLDKEVTIEDNNTIEYVYKEYLDEFNERQTRWNKIYRLDGMTMNHRPYEVPLTEVEFVRELATTSINQYAIFKLVEKALVNQLDVDRAEQRAGAIGTFARTLAKGGIFAAKGLGIAGRAALKGLYTKIKSFISAISSTKWAGYIRGYKKLLMSNLRKVYEEGLGAPKWALNLEKKLMPSSVGASLVDDVIGMAGQTPRIGRGTYSGGAGWIRNLADDVDGTLVSYSSLYDAQYRKTIDWLFQKHAPLTESELYLKQWTVGMLTAGLVQDSEILFSDILRHPINKPLSPIMNNMIGIVYELDDAYLISSLVTKTNDALTKPYVLNDLMLLESARTEDMIKKWALNNTPAKQILSVEYTPTGIVVRELMGVKDVDIIGKNLRSTIIKGSWENGSISGFSITNTTNNIDQRIRATIKVGEQAIATKSAIDIAEYTKLWNSLVDSGNSPTTEMWMIYNTLTNTVDSTYGL